MKTIFTLITLLVFTNFGFAQPVISNIVPNFGDQMVYAQAENPPSTGASGANVIWDYSVFVGDELSANYIVNHPSDVEGSDDFPNATMVWTVDIGFAILNSFMSFANNQFATYGTVSSFSGMTSGTFLQNPDVLVTYPIHYQDTGSNNYSGIVLSGGIESPLTGESSYVVDGYGTIHTPYGTYENVLRVTTTKIQTLSSFGFESINNITETSWYSPDYLVPVYLMSSSIETIMGLPSDSSSAATALASYTGVTGIDKIDANVLFNIYPNPATDYITIASHFQGAATLSIFSIDGKLVVQKSVQRNDQVHLEKLQAGFYIARLQVADKQFTQSSFVVK